MAARRLIQGLILIALVAGALSLLLHRRSSQPEAPSVLVPVTGVLPKEPDVSTGEPAREEIAQEVREEAAPPLARSPNIEEWTAKPRPNKPPEETTQLSPAELRELLPEWMDYEGVHLHSEHVTIAGRTIARSRGRFEWPNGSFMEMEVTDLGPDPDETLLKSLGFNVNALSNAPASESASALEIPSGIVSQEYDEEAAEGFIQLVVGDRFLVEVQLEKLPYESFQSIVDFQIPMDALIDLAAQEHK